MSATAHGSGISSKPASAIAPQPGAPRAGSLSANGKGMFALCLLAAMVLVVSFGPVIYRVDPTKSTLYRR